MSRNPIRESLERTFLGCVNALPPRAFGQAYNFVQTVRGRSSKITSVQEEPLCLEICDGDGVIRTFGKDRAWYYGPGISRRLENLARSYGLHVIDLRPGDIFIDCGANIGELGLWAAPRKVEYVPLEPDPTPGRLLTLNLPGQDVRALCLWKEPGQLTFYKKSETADSSAIEMSDYSQRIDVQATTLDRLLESLGDRPVKLLKVEAEGAEPEVLQGLSEKAGMIRYVTVDVGYERGIDAENTACPALNYLYGLGFKLKFANIRQSKFLFENSAYVGGAA